VRFAGEGAAGFPGRRSASRYDRWVAVEPKVNGKLGRGASSSVLPPPTPMFVRHEEGAGSPAMLCPGEGTFELTAGTTAQGWGGGSSPAASVMAGVFHLIMLTY
jgi:hypothetical protein